ncbi:unnamed protein product [Somion occarium]|uniref:Thioredoxin domain-containing protein n=1 Tax=Somion occarium TaxID=3059160 RepID=A0ABP1E595_9APHY
MLLSNLFAVSLALTPSLVSAALFSKDSLVKSIDPKGFREALKENITSVVAFVAPWCGHCQRMAPELNKAALGLYPLIPTYAVDCDKYKGFCAKQGVQGFPTVKVWPRGRDSDPVTFDGPDRTIYKVEDVPKWVQEHSTETRALLVNNGKHIPLLWQVLANKYRDYFAFAIHRDRKGKSSVKMGMEAGAKGTSKVLIYPPGKTDFVRFEGITKYDSLSKFFDSIIDGTANLEIANKEAAQEDFVPDETELEIERQQEAQRMALAHGGFSDLIDFEEAVKQYGTDFHGKHGYPGMMGGPPMPMKKDAKSNDDKPEDPIQKILKHQKEEAEKSAKAPKMAKTGDGGEIVLEVPTETGHPKTPVADAAATETPAESTLSASSSASSDVPEELLTSSTVEPTATSEHDSVPRSTAHDEL